MSQTPDEIIPGKPVDGLVEIPVESRAQISPTSSENSQTDRKSQKFIAALRQVDEVIEYETTALANHATPDFNDIKARKARGLQALNMAISELDGQIMDTACRKIFQARLTALQDRLNRNRQLLQIHIDAVGELVELINSAAWRQETDGTYDMASLAKGSRSITQ